MEDRLEIGNPIPTRILWQRRRRGQQAAAGACLGSSVDPIDDLTDAVGLARERQGAIAFGRRSHFPSDRHHTVDRIDVQIERLDGVVEPHLGLDLGRQSAIAQRLTRGLGGRRRLLRNLFAGTLDLFDTALALRLRPRRCPEVPRDAPHQPRKKPPTATSTMMSTISLNNALNIRTSCLEA